MGNVGASGCRLVEGSVYLLIHYCEQWELDTGISEVFDVWAFLGIFKASFLVVFQSQQKVEELLFPWGLRVAWRVFNGTGLCVQSACRVKRLILKKRDGGCFGDMGLWVWSLLFAILCQTGTIVSPTAKGDALAFQMYAKCSPSVKFTLKGCLYGVLRNGPAHQVISTEFMFFFYSVCTFVHVYWKYLSTKCIGEEKLESVVVFATKRYLDGL